MKIVLIIILISVIMVIAFAVSEQYKDKFDFYTYLKLFFEQFKINLSYKQDKIVEFLNKLNPKKQFKLFILDYKDYLNTGELTLKNIKILEDEEIDELSDIVKTLGTHDAKSEINQLDSYIATINLKKEKAEIDKQKLCPMIIKLSLLFSIGLAILLV